MAAVAAKIKSPAPPETGQKYSFVLDADVTLGAALPSLTSALTIQAGLGSILDGADFLGRPTRKAAVLHAQQPLRNTLVKGFLPLFAVFFEALRKGWDVYAAAINDARAKADAAAAQELNKMSSALPMPPGFKLPF